MKGNWLLAVTSILLSLTLGLRVLAQEAKGPKMVLPERQFDFGLVREGEVIQHTFMVENQGDEELKIIRVKPG